jgi:putative DNA primase/helicase
MVKAFADHLLKQAWREAAGPEKIAKSKEKERQAIFKAAQKMAGHGGIAGLDDPPVAEDPVSGQLLIEEFVKVAQRFLVVPETTIRTMALWALSTYVFDFFEVFPYLVLSSPVKRCGKTTTKKLLGAFVRRPLMASSVSPAVIYRVIEAYRPTLLLDEVDALLASKDENLRGVLNAGHERSGVVLRCEGESLEPSTFSTFSPKVLALIGRLPDTLADRSIAIPMKRKKKGEARERLTRAPYQQIIADGEIWRGKALRWAQDRRDDLQTTGPRMPEALGDRETDNWEPLFAVAQILGGDWPARVMEAAETLAAGDQDEGQEVSVVLLADVKALWPPKEEKMLTATLLEELRKLEDRAWPTYGKSGKGLTARDLSFLLGKYDIRPKQVWVKALNQNHRGYQKSDFTDAWERYLVAEKPHPPNPTPLIR